jgi:hypothetical protein
MCWDAWQASRRTTPRGDDGRAPLSDERIAFFAAHAADRIPSSNYEGRVQHAIRMAEAAHGIGVSEDSGRPAARLMAAAPDLLADLRDAAATLRRYESLHLAKGTSESLEKAAANAALAARFEQTIAKATEASS